MGRPPQSSITTPRHHHCGVPLRTHLVAAGLVAALSASALGFGVANADDQPSSPQSATTQAAPAPLGADGRAAIVTDGQARVEKLGRQILATDMMRQQLDQTKALYAASAVGQTPTGKASTDTAANAIAAAAVLYALSLDTDRPFLTWDVNAEHHFAGLNFPNSGFGIENPDNVYRNTMLAGNSAYRIHGRWPANRPTQLHFELRDALPGTTDLTFEAGNTIGALPGDEIVTNPDGTFDITIDSTPADGGPNHLQIPADTTSFLVVRDLLNNWATEDPVYLDIKRVSGPPVAPEKTLDQQAADSAQILGKIAPFWLKYFDTFVYHGTAKNTVFPLKLRPGGRGVATIGWFDLADDEAMVITLDPAGAKSLGIQITNPFGTAYEYRNRTSSFNTTQAAQNPDGTYTYVIAKNDPGIANWLDPSGNSSGMVSLRWQQLGANPSADGAIRTTQVVKLGDLKSTLPPTTSTMSHGERAQQRAHRAQDWDHRLKG